MLAAREEIVTLSSTDARPSSMASSVSRMVITLFTLATGRRSSAFFSKITRPVEASQRIALGLVSVMGTSASIGCSSAQETAGSISSIRRNAANMPPRRSRALNPPSRSNAVSIAVCFTVCSETVLFLTWETIMGCRPYPLGDFIPKPHLRFAAVRRSVFFIFMLCSPFTAP